MRPVHRGDAPGIYADYKNAIGDLEDRLGIYCSYCERRLPASLAVEHLVPKSIDADLELTWTNFLLGCANCNSIKSNKPTNEEDFLWPDRDNTFLAFDYVEGGFVRVVDGLAPEIEAKAIALCDLVGLDRHRFASEEKQPSRRDKRWRDREQVWKTATTQKERLDQFPPEVRHLAKQYIVEAAEGYGFFSVWMAVFADDTEIRLSLIAKMPGTAPDSFDQIDATPRKRPNGRI